MRMNEYNVDNIFIHIVLDLHLGHNTLATLFDIILSFDF